MNRSLRPILITIIMISLSSIVMGQNQALQFSTLTEVGIQLDDIDKKWLSEHESFLNDMSNLAKMDTSSMNRAIIQMSTKLLSNDLIDISDERARENKALIKTIIYGALDDHGKEAEKSLSPMSWYNMIKREIKI